MKASTAAIIYITLVSSSAYAADLSYEEISKRYAESSLTKESLNKAKMQGECLVGLKELTFKKKNKFDPVAEWTNYRSVSFVRAILTL